MIGALTESIYFGMIEIMRIILGMIFVTVGWFIGAFVGLFIGHLVNFLR